MSILCALSLTVGLLASTAIAAGNSKFTDVPKGGSLEMAVSWAADYGITAYCEKHGAYCTYKAENGWFTLQSIQTIWTA